MTDTHNGFLTVSMMIGLLEIAHLSSAPLSAERTQAEIETPPRQDACWQR